IAEVLENLGDDAHGRILRKDRWIRPQILDALENARRVLEHFAVVGFDDRNKADAGLRLDRLLHVARRPDLGELDLLVLQGRSYLRGEVRHRCGVKRPRPGAHASPIRASVRQVQVWSLQADYACARSPASLPQAAGSPGFRSRGGSGYGTSRGRRTSGGPARRGHGGG